MQHLRLKQEYCYFKNIKWWNCIDTSTGISQWLRYRMTLPVTLKVTLGAQMGRRWLIDCFRRGKTELLFYVIFYRGFTNQLPNEESRERTNQIPWLGHESWWNRSWDTMSQISQVSWGSQNSWAQPWTCTDQSCFGTRKTIGVKEVHLITNDLAVRRR